MKSQCQEDTFSAVICLTVFEYMHALYKLRVALSIESFYESQAIFSYQSSELDDTFAV